MKNVSVERAQIGGAESQTKSQSASTIPVENRPGHGSPMKAVVQDGYGAPQRVLKLGEAERPSVGDDDVLVRMRATSVNTPDWVTVTGVPYITRLKFGLRRPPTPVRGTDIAEIVEAVGKNVTDLEPGDEVFGSSWADTLATPGTFAEFTVAPASRLIKKPVRLSFESVPTPPEAPLTSTRVPGPTLPTSRMAISAVIGADGPDQRDVPCAAHAGDLRAERPGDLHRPSRRSLSLATSGWSSTGSTRSARPRTRSPTCLDTMP